MRFLSGDLRSLQSRSFSRLPKSFLSIEKSEGHNMKFSNTLIVSCLLGIFGCSTPTSSSKNLRRVNAKKNHVDNGGGTITIESQEDILVVIGDEGDSLFIPKGSLETGSIVKVQRAANQDIDSVEIVAAGIDVGVTRTSEATKESGHEILSPSLEVGIPLPQGSNPDELYVGILVYDSNGNLGFKVAIAMDDENYVSIEDGIVWIKNPFLNSETFLFRTVDGVDPFNIGFEPMDDTSKEVEVNEFSNASTTTTTSQANSLPSAPAINAVASSGSQILVNWAAVGSDIASYVIVYQEGSAAAANCDGQINATTQSTSQLISGLNANTQYSVIACSVDSKGLKSVASNAVSVTTKVSFSVSSTSSTVNWVNNDVYPDWNSFENASNRDGVSANVSDPDDHQFTDQLRFTSFLNGGNAIVPANSLINGIVVTCRWYGQTRSFYKTSQMQLLKSGNSAGDNLGDNPKTTVPNEGGLVDATFGSPPNLWGTSWTAAEINDPNFGLVVRFLFDGEASGTPNLSLDYCGVTVHYSLP